MKTVTQPELQSNVRRLKEAGARLITIVGTDVGTSLELTYFFHTGAGKSEVLRVVEPKKGGNEEFDSITPIFPAAYIAENEASEMFGIKIKGIPGRFFLPDGITTPLRRKEA